MQPKILIRSLKGSAAQILLAFLFARRAMDVKEIQSWTNLKRETIYSSMAALDGLIVKQTLAHGRDVFLPGGDLLPLFQVLISDAPELQESVKRTSGDAVIVFNPPLLNIKDSSVNNNNKAQESVKRTPDEFGALLEALAKYRIVGKKKAELIACEWVTAEYVCASVEFTQAEGRGQYAVGIAINRMLEEMEQPSRRENGHIENCQCDECSVSQKNNSWMSFVTCSDCGKFPCECEHADDCECMSCRREFPERFCKAVYETGRGNQRGLFQDCKALAVPGSHYCEQHQDPGTRGRMDQDGKSEEET